MSVSEKASDEELSIKPFKANDLDAIMEIENRSFTMPWSRNSYEELWPQEAIQIWVGWLGRELAGYYLMQSVEQEQELHTFAVKPELRRRGIGRRLLTHMLDRARGLGVRNIYLQVRPSNAAAKALYASLGFVAIGIRRNYYRDDSEDALVMCLNLVK